MFTFEKDGLDLEEDDVLAFSNRIISNSTITPKVKRIRVDNDQICPESPDTTYRSSDFSDFNPTKCAEFRKDGYNYTYVRTGHGRWDGILTVYPKKSASMINVEIEFDEQAMSLSVCIPNKKKND